MMKLLRGSLTLGKEKDGIIAIIFAPEAEAEVPALYVLFV